MGWVGYCKGEGGMSEAEQITALKLAAEAAIRYDKAIAICANSPKKMSSFCSAEGEDLDFLYADWISKSRAALSYCQQCEGSAAHRTAAP